MLAQASSCYTHCLHVAENIVHIKFILSTNITTMAGNTFPSDLVFNRCIPCSASESPGWTSRPTARSSADCARSRWWWLDALVLEIPRLSQPSHRHCFWHAELRGSSLPVRDIKRQFEIWIESTNTDCKRATCRCDRHVMLKYLCKLYTKHKLTKGVRNEEIKTVAE